MVPISFTLNCPNNSVGTFLAAIEIAILALSLKGASEFRKSSITSQERSIILKRFDSSVVFFLPLKPFFPAMTLTHIKIAT